MSMYNMLHGFNPGVIILLPMLKMHPDSIPRFRDCYLGEDENCIAVYTRLGAGNRECFCDEFEEKSECYACKAETVLRKHKNYIRDFDDNDYDSTYATFLFSVPEEFKEDFKKIKEGKIKDTSENYKNTVFNVFPKIKDKIEACLMEVLIEK